MSTEPLEIQLLGGFRIRRGSRLIPDDAWKLRKAAGIVKLLALAPGHRLHREQVLDTLWPELEPDAAANNFRYALHTARQILDPERSNAATMLYREGDWLILAAPELVWVDVKALESAIEVAWQGEDVAAFQAAARLYTGDLLPADRYEESLDLRRTALKTTYLALLARLARLYQERGDPASTIETLQQLVAADGAHEEAHAGLILLYARAGRRSEALAQYDRLVEVLAAELETEPDPVTQQLAQAVREGGFTQSLVTPESKKQKTPTNLPAQPTALIGRERELAEVRQSMSRVRLVTLTGTGGAGKTRLGLAVAHEVSSSFSNGVFFVALAPIQQPELIATAMIHALGIRETSGQTPVETLLEFLRERTILLVLDNFEHVVDGAPVVGTLLEECPQLTVLATSRVPLRLRGEQEYRLRPLLNDASTELFIQRAREVKPDFDPVGSQAAAVTEICQRLDGLPLAIELAAARSRVLSPLALLSRLKHPLGLLTGGARDLPERQRTLRNTIAWSYNLLQPDEQRLFQALSVCAGGWSLEVADAVGTGEIDALDGLTALVGSSLVEQLDGLDGEPRFRMLETIREFACEQLAGSGEEDQAHERHARFFADFAGVAMPLLRGPQKVLWLDRLEQEHANLRAALDWFIATDDIETCVHIIAPLTNFWDKHGHLTISLQHHKALLARINDTVAPATRSEAYGWAGMVHEWNNDLNRATELYNEALDIGLDLPVSPEGVGRALIGLGNIARHHGNVQTATSYYEEAFSVCERHNYLYVKALTLGSLGSMAAIRGDPERAIDLYEQNLILTRSIGDPWPISLATGNLGEILLKQGRFREAQPLLEEALALNRAMNHRRHMMIALYALGMLKLYQGNLNAAATLTEESLDIAEEFQGSVFIALAKLGLGRVARRRGDPGQARVLFHESLAAGRAATSELHLASAVEGLAAASHDTGESEYAVRLYAMAAASRERAGTPLTSIDRYEIEQGLAAARESLTQVEFDAAWATGSEMTLEQIHKEQTV